MVLKTRSTRVKSWLVLEIEPTNRAIEVMELEGEHSTTTLESQHNS